MSQKDLENRLTSAMTELSTLKESAHVSDKDQLAMLCAVSSEADTLRRRMIDMERLSADLATAMQENAALKAKVYEGEMARRKLHNVIQVSGACVGCDRCSFTDVHLTRVLQELRGNIRVFVRVRPPLPSDAEAAGSVPPMTCSADGLRIVFVC